MNLASYRKVVPEKFSRLTVVWIGSPATYNYLLNAHEHLLAMRAVADFELLVIGGEPLPEHPLSDTAKAAAHIDVVILFIFLFIVID